MTISFSGLASGLDTSSWIESLTALKQAKVDTLEEEKEAVALSRETLNNIKSFFTSFRSLIEKVTDTKFNVSSMDLFAQKLATSSNTDILTAIATPEADEGTYEIKVDKLASNAKATSEYTYYTTIVETTTATNNSKLKDLGIKSGNIGVTVNGAEQIVNISENDTIKELVNKLTNIGANASFNEETGIFNINVGADAINDIDNTGIIDGLNLSGVNKGYSSGELTTEKIETVYNPADGNTKVSELGVKAGDIIIQANDAEYQLTIEDDDTIQDILDALNANNIDAKLENGIFSINNAIIVDDGTTDLIDAFGLTSEIGSSTQKSDSLSQETQITETVSATSDTLLKDLNGASGLKDGDTVIVKDAENNFTTITLSETSTLGDLIDKLNDAGLTAILRSNGKVAISDGIITGGSFDLEGVLGLEFGQISGIVTGSSLITETEVYADENTTFSELGIDSAEFQVLNSDGDLVTSLNITGSQTLGELFENLSTNYGIEGSISNGVIRLTSDSGNVLIADELGIGTETIVSQTIITQTSNSNIEWSNTITADSSTTFADLGLDGLEYQITNAEDSVLLEGQLEGTVQDWFNTLSGYGITASINDGIISFTSANGNKIIGEAADAMGLETTTSISTVTNIVVSSESPLYSTVTQTVWADGNTRLDEIIDWNNSSSSTVTYNITGTINSDGEVTLYDEYNSPLASVTLSADMTVQEMLDELAKIGVKGHISNGVITLDAGDKQYLKGDIIDALGIENTIHSKTVLSAEYTYATISAITSKDPALSDLTQLGQDYGSYTITGTLNADGSITGGTVVAVSTEADLKAMAEYTYEGESYNGYIFVLTNDIKLTDSNWEHQIQLGDASIFDGQGHNIELNISSSGNAALFHSAGGDWGGIKNLSTSGTVIALGTGTAAGITNFLWSDSTFINVSSSATLISKNGSASGLIGTSLSNSSIRNVEFSGTIIANSGKIGGIVGTLGCVLEQAVFSGTINAAQQTNSYIGGIAGYMESTASVRRSIVTGDVLVTDTTSGTYNIGNVAGYLELQTNRTINIANTCYTYSSNSHWGATGNGGNAVNSYVSEVISTTEEKLVTDAAGILNLAPEVFTYDPDNPEGGIHKRAVSSRNIDIYDSNNNLVDTVVVHDGMSLNDINSELSKYGVEFTLGGGGVIGVDNSGTHYIDGGFLDNLGIKLEGVNVFEEIDSVEESASDQFTTEGKGYITEDTLWNDIEGNLQTGNGIDVVNEDGFVANIQTAGKTLGEIFDELAIYGITGSINDGKLTFTSQNGYSISDPIDLVDETGWTFTTNISSGTTAGKVFESTQTVTYTEESAITLNTKLGDFLDLSDTIIYNHNVSDGSVNEKDLNDLAQDNYNKTAEELTVAEFLNILHWDLNYDTGFSDNGEISLSIEDGSYYLSGSIFDQMGIDIESGVTTGVSLTSSSAVTYESIVGIQTVTTGATQTSTSAVTYAEYTGYSTFATVNESTTLTSGSYVISTTADLQKLSTMTNSGKIGADTYFILANNINFSNTTLTAIGTEANPFKGTFNGNGYTISNLKLTSTTTGRIALFGVTKGATITNIGVSNLNISTSSADGGQVGGLVGIAYSSTKISNSYVTGTIRITGSNGGCVAGLVGNLREKSSVTNCAASVYVSATGDNIGGFVGMVKQASIEDSFAKGTVTGGGKKVGGFAGNSYSATIKDSWSSGSVSGSSNIGGFLGYAENTPSISNSKFYNNSSLSGCGNNSSLSGITKMTGSAPTTSVTSKLGSKIVIPKQTKTMTSSTTFAQLGLSANETITLISDGTTYTYTVTTTASVGTLMNYLNGKGFTTSLTSGKLTIKGAEGVYFKTDFSDTLDGLLNFAEKSGYGSSGIATLQTMTLTSTETITEDTSMSEIYDFNPAHPSEEICIIDNGSRKYIAISPNDTIGEFIDKMNDAGIQASLLNGKLYLTPESGITFEHYQGNDYLLGAFNIDDEAYYKTYVEQTMTTSDPLYTGETKTLTGDTTISDLGLSASNINIEISKMAKLSVQ